MNSEQHRSRPARKQSVRARIKALIGDIQDTMGVAWPPAVWLAYSAYPKVVELFWERLKPTVATERFLREALEISERAYRDAANWYHPGFRPEVREEERQRIQHELDAFEFGNPQLLIQQVALGRAILGEVVGTDEPVQPRQHPSSYREPEIQLVDEDRAPEDVKEVFQDIKRTLELPLVNSDYRAMAKWPSFLKPAWQDAREYRQGEGYQRLQQELARMAEEAVGRLAPPIRVDQAELLEALGDPGQLEKLRQTMQMFVRLLPGLIVNDALFRIAAARKRQRPVARRKAAEEPRAERPPKAAPRRRAPAGRLEAPAPGSLDARLGREVRGESRQRTEAGAPPTEVAEEYRFQHYRRDDFLRDTSFGGGPLPGQPMPDFDLPVVGGGRVRKSDFGGTQPLLLTIGSITCPMTATAGPVLKRLHGEFGDRVAFVTLYVRELHPGERYPQPRSVEQKLAHARAYKERDWIPWAVAVDSLDGELHRTLGANSNAAYLTEVRGNVAFRALWSNDEGALRQALEAVVSREPVPTRDAKQAVVPLLKGAGVMHEVLDLAGPGAARDAFRETPPIFLLGLLASLYRPLSPLGRGIAGLTTGVLGLMALLGGLGWLLSRRR